ncbi:DeoR/GlpR family DNA-binding transcription regulator [Clostridium gasigenes]|uniref:DeoR/GlpR family DNA-binding transcription regulator n=1 Tax=Clostridium gasigenes TaxID=94869 RepID=UPI00143833FE|nr:DeoR/GlpR family DNA-binding transcription regulator [Clostridium gasigenes]MBU3104777.1 DeoR/GlpR family DNA-binding transcription regulator [Clostridium gasigenes]MBU3137196.1 DeoR/GlpR family DNA-binding transcription regulator [Clostridium gasigenes]NKF07817.1 DeoR/GlpR transcriptional regulator [Clostridium gasigenes]QSW20415.1 DeoR/GlpR transcriptional regulator [Clostridium gasigenes]
MLTEQRYQIILNEIDRKSLVYVSELVKDLDTSESTIRRDLNFLHKQGKLKKVHGGATALDKFINTKDDLLSTRESLNIDEKLEIAKYAANLIKENDFVYIDAGTTTDLMIEFINEKEAVYITNGINQAKKLINKGLKTYILGGEIKESTEAIIGVEAINTLKRYNFNKGFFGTNGISKDRGYTTPDISEALVKQEALRRTREAYIMADNSKFDEISCVTFGELEDATIITTIVEDNTYKEFIEIIEVAKK